MENSALYFASRGRVSALSFLVPAFSLRVPLLLGRGSREELDEFEQILKRAKRERGGDARLGRISAGEGAHESEKG